MARPASAGPHAASTLCCAIAALSVVGALAAAEDAGPVVAPGGGDLSVTSVTAASVPGPSEIRPHILGGLKARTCGGLTVAFRVAAERLHDRQGCRALFSELGTDGLALLRATRYQSVAEVGGERVCRRGTGVAAFTSVGNARTIICPGFDRLNVKEAAVIVLHEALHFAGLPESPPTPGAMTSSEINDRIADRCGL